MKNLVQQLAEVRKFYITSSKQTQDVKLQLLLQQLAEEKERYAQEISDCANGDIEVDPRVEFNSSLTNAMNYLRLLTARKDVELISLCLKKEKSLYDKLIDLRSQDDISYGMITCLEKISSLVKKTIDALEEERHAKQIEA